MAKIKAMPQIMCIPLFNWFTETFENWIYACFIIANAVHNPDIHFILRHLYFYDSQELNDYCFGAGVT